MSILVVAEGTQEQSADEKLVYTVDVTNWGSSPTSATVACVAIDETTGTTVTTSVFDPSTGAGSASANIITCPVLQSLVKGHTYRIEVFFVIGANSFECYFRVECTI